MSLRPWRLAQRGTLTVSGVVLDAHDPPGATARVALTLWEPGCEVIDLGDRWAVLWRRGRERRHDALPGAPLVTLRRDDGAALYSTIPLQRNEFDALIEAGARSGDLALARAGVAETHPLAAAPRVDLAAWIAWDALDIAAEASSLGDPPASVLPSRDDGPAWFAKVTGPALAGALGEAMSEASGGASAAAPWWLRLAERLRSLVRARDEVRRALASHDALVAPRDDVAPERSLAPQGSWWERLVDRLARSVWGARIEKLLGARQARYLGEMVEMFERGELEEALRHAIPLGGKGPDGVDRPLTWSVPRPREALSISLDPAVSTTAAAVPDLHERLRSLYHDAVARLDAEGRAEEAAFVLAELLREPEAAVALLERHGRFASAAALADRARMPPPARVRQWLRAEDRARAFAIARKHRCWEDAATLLLERAPEQAAWLRGEHARHLARTGDLSAAVLAGERVPAMRDEVLGWIDALIARGGTDAARALPQRLRADGGSFETVRSLTLALCDGREARAERRVLAASLMSHKADAACAALARPLLRALVADAARSGDSDDARVIAQLLTWSGDETLRADLPRWPLVARANLSLVTSAAGAAPPRTARIALADRGLRAVEDLALLPDGRLLLAMGESGAELWSRAGRLLRRFDEPCDRIVLSTHGDRALALGSRGASVRVATLDLTGMRASHWCDLRAECWADTFDGDTWLVSQDGHALALDVTAAEATALRVLAEPPRDLASKALAMQRGDKLLGALSWQEDRDRGDAFSGYTTWSTRDGARVEARALDAIGDPARRPALCALDLSRERVLRVDPDGERWRLTVIARSGRTPIALHDEPIGLWAGGGWSCVISRVEAGALATLRNASDTPCLSVLLEGSARGVARIQPGALLIGDELGRVRAFETSLGETTHDLRV